MESKLKDNNVDFLLSAILKLQDLDECYRFFEDLCTAPEIKAMSQRIVVAKMLNEKRVYADIVAATKASTTTISRVNRALTYGCDAYQRVFERLKEETK